MTADLNEIPEAYVEHVSKFLPILRQREFGLGRAADYLQSLCDGTLVRFPLLDVNQILDHCDVFSSFWWKLQSRHVLKLRIRLRRSREDQERLGDLFSRTARDK